MKDRIELQNVVVLGRAFEEYCTYFQLTEEDLRSSYVLDLGAGLSSFCAEASAHGYYVTDLPNRYVCASLPETPFADREFSIVLVSYFLFLYDDLLSYEFHKRSVLEAIRIAQKEVRIYPLVNMRAERSAFVEQLRHDPECAGLQFDLLKSDFEFFRNSNELLIIRRA